MAYVFESQAELSDYLDEPEDSSDNSLNLEYLNSSLASYGFPRLGNLCSNSQSDVKQTLDCVYAMLAQKQKDVSTKDQLIDDLAKLKSDRSIFSDKADRLTLEVERMGKEVGRLQTQLTLVAEKAKKDREQSRLELIEAQKRALKLAQRDPQYLNEIRKKDAMIARLKDQLRRQDKDLGYRNHIDVTEALHSKGPAVADADSEYAYMVAKGYDENINALLTENQDLRNAFETLQRELFSIVRVRKEALGGLDLDHGMEAMRCEVLELPFRSVSEDVIGAFSENIQKFKEFIEKSSALMQ
jgi:X breakpoint 2-interacting protein